MIGFAASRAISGSGENDWFNFGHVGTCGNRSLCPNELETDIHVQNWSGDHRVKTYVCDNSAYR